MLELLHVEAYFIFIIVDYICYKRLFFRCIHITDIGIGYISTMICLQALFLRWCSQLRNFSIQHLCGMRHLRILSLAGNDLKIHAPTYITRHFPKKSWRQVRKTRFCKYNSCSYKSGQSYVQKI